MSWQKTAALVAISAGGGLAAGSGVHSPIWISGPTGLALIASAFYLSPRARTAALVGWIGGASYFAAALPFLITGYASIGMTGFQPTIGVLGLYALLSIWWPIAFGLASRPWKIGRVPALMLLWPAAELLRSYVFPAIPVAQVASIWSQTPIVQLTRPLTVELVGALTLAICVHGAALLARRKVPILAVGAMMCAAGVGSILAAPKPLPETPRVAAIDTALPQRLRWDYDALPAYMADLTARTQDAFANGAELVIWPEASIPFFPDELQDELQDARPPAGAYLALGMMVPIESEPGRFWNSFVVLDTDLNEVARYDKRHLFPFGEYIPFAEALDRWLGLTTIASSTNALAHGRSAPTMPLAGLPGTLIPAICYEGSFAVPRAAREAEGAYIVNISNDAWWAGSHGARFVEQEARLRAVEAGLPLVRVPNMWSVQVFDGAGHPI